MKIKENQTHAIIVYLANIRHTQLIVKHQLSIDFSFALQYAFAEQGSITLPLFCVVGQAQI